MMDKRILVVGIDPGTTTAVSGISITGEIVFIKSKKEYDLSALFKDVINHGLPLIVGCDKARSPSFVDEFSAKTGARLVCPNEDLKVNDKKELTKGFNVKNDHEMDALASALFALRKFKPLLTKIDVFLKYKKKEELKEKMLSLILANEGLNIRSALTLIEHPEKKDMKIISEVITKKRVTEKQYYELFERYQILLDEFKTTKEENIKLMNENKKIQSKKHYEKTPKDYEKKIRLKDSVLHYNLTKIKEKERELKELQDEFKGLNTLFSNLKNKILLKKLFNLTKEEYTKNKILNISNNDVLYVKDLTQFSQEVITELTGKVSYIITDKSTLNLKKTLNFNILDSKQLNIIESRYFAVIDKDKFIEESKKFNLLSKVIKEYKEERNI